MSEQVKLSSDDEFEVDEDEDEFDMRLSDGADE